MSNEPNEPKITRLPSADRDTMLRLNGLDGSPHWREVNRWGHGPDDAESFVPHEDVTERDLEERGFIVEGGWHPVSIKGGAREGGITSHRGVLHPDEYVNDDVLIAAIEQELGFTYDDIRAVYRQGPLSESQRELRGRIDARLLALSRSGGHMIELARWLGWAIDAGTSQSGPTCKTMKRALARAREAEKAA